MIWDRESVREREGEDNNENHEHPDYICKNGTQASQGAATRNSATLQPARKRHPRNLARSFDSPRSFSFLLLLAHRYGDENNNWGRNIYFVSFVAFVAVCVCPRERKKKPTTRVHEHGEERPRRTNNENPSRHGIYQRTDGRITAVSVQYILTKRQQRKRKPRAYTYLGLESSHRGSKRGNRHVDDGGWWVKVEWITSLVWSSSSSRVVIVELIVLRPTLQGMYDNKYSAIFLCSWDLVGCEGSLFLSDIFKFSH